MSHIAYGNTDKTEYHQLLYAESAQTFGRILLDSFRFFLQNRDRMMNSIRSASIEYIVKAKGVPLELHIVGVGCQVQIELHIADADMSQTGAHSIFFDFNCCKQLTTNSR